MDWVGELEDENGMDFVIDALAEREDNGEAVLAAAELIAALTGHPSPDLPEEITDWIVDKPAPTRELREAALKAVRWTREDSDLQELWERDENWLEVIDELDQRLRRGIVKRTLKPRDLDKLRAKRKALEDEWLAENPLKQEGAVGDLIGIPLRDGRWALGQIVEYEPRTAPVYSTAAGVGVLFRQAVKSADDVPRSLGIDDVVACMAWCFDHLEAATWRIFDRDRDLTAARRAHELAVRRDETEFTGWYGATIAEGLANAYHALEPWAMSRDHEPLYERYLLTPDLRPAVRTYGD